MCERGIERLSAVLAESKLFFEAKPEIIGRGAEHIVIGFEGAPRDVQKLSMLLLWREVRDVAKQGEKNPRELFVALNELLCERWEYILERNNEVRHAFGDAMPQEKVHVRQLLLTPEVFGKLIDAWAARKEEKRDREAVKAWFGTEPLKVPFLVREQKRARPGQLTLQAFPIRARYTDMYLAKTDPALYSAAMRRFVQGEKQKSGIRPLLPMVFHADGIAFAERILTDDALREHVRTFVENAIKYTDEDKTDRILDFIGKNNVNMYQEGEHVDSGRGESCGWRTILLDAQYPDEKYESVWRMGKNAAEDVWVSFHRQYMKEGRTVIRDGRQIALLNALAYVRTVNALAELSGSKKRLPFIDDADAFRGEQWFYAMESLHVYGESGALKPAWPERPTHQRQRGVGKVVPPDAQGISASMRRRQLLGEDPVEEPVVSIGRNEAT